MPYKPENIVIGTMPGPKKTINSYLTPLVIELNEAWHNGIHIFSPQNTPTLNVLFHLSLVTFLQESLRVFKSQCCVRM